MAYTITIKDTAGKQVAEYAFADQLCNDELVNESLLHEYVVMYLANQRVALAHTKTRGEVQRSGRKLYKQKGSGRARVGDAGSPIRRKGGVAFGPRNEENYAKRMPKKMKRRALLWALTLKVKQGMVQWLSSYDDAEIKTKNAVAVLKSFGIGDKKTLLVIPESNEVVVKSFRNIEGVSVTPIATLNAYDLLSHTNVVFRKAALEKLENPSFVS